MLRGARIFAAVMAATIAGAGVAGGAIAAAAAEAPAGVALAKVAPGSKTDAKGSYYAFTAGPGSTTTQQLVVGNTTKQPIDAHIDAVDGITRDATGVGYTASGVPAKATGDW